MRSLKRWILGLFVGCCATTVVARAVTSDEALSVASAWCSQNHVFIAEDEATTADVVRTETGEILYYKVLLQPRGVIIVAGDTNIQPILAVLPEAITTELPEQHPLTALLQKDISQRRAFLLEDKSTSLRTNAAIEEDPAIITARTTANAQWEQLLGTALQPLALESDGNPAHIFSWLEGWRPTNTGPGKYAHWNQFYPYNFYTPHGYPTGCVATAGAAIMEFFQVSHGPKGILFEGNELSNLYDWSLLWGEMDAAKELVSRISYQMGVLVNMDYQSDASGAYITDLERAFKQGFGLQSAQHFHGDDLERFVYAQIRCGAPVALGVGSKTGPGHAIVACGYGEDVFGTAYTRLFMGWGSSGDGWYALPDIKTGSNVFVSVDDGITGISPDDKAVAIYGQVLKADGTPEVNTTVTITGSDDDVVTVTTGTLGEYGVRISTQLSACTVSVEGYPAQTIDLTETNFPDAVNFPATPKTPWSAPVYRNLEDTYRTALREGKCIAIVGAEDNGSFGRRVLDELREMGDAFAKDFTLLLWDSNVSTKTLWMNDGELILFSPNRFTVAYGRNNPWLANNNSGITTAETLDNARNAWTKPTLSSVSINGLEQIYHSARYRVWVNFSDGTYIDALTDNCLEWRVSTDVEMTDESILYRGDKTGTVTLTVTGECLGQALPTTSKTVTFSTDPMVNLYGQKEGSSYHITGRNGQGEVEVIIPDEVQGVPVTTIAKEAFAYAQDIRRVTLSEGIQTIESKAFYRCPNLTEVHLPSTLQYLGVGAFRHNAASFTLTLPPDHPSFTFSDGILLRKDNRELHLMLQPIETYSIPTTIERLASGAFYEHPTLKTLTIPGTVTTIDAEAVRNCDTLENLTLCEGIEVIGENAFEGCDWLLDFTFPKSITTIGAGAFRNCRTSHLAFLGPPPHATDTSFTTNAYGWYLPTLSSLWESEIESGMWHGLMMNKPQLIFPETLTDATTKNWLTEQLLLAERAFIEAPITLTLRNDCTPTTFAAAARLGITPLIKRNNDYKNLEIAADGKMEIVDLHVHDDALTFNCHHRKPPRKLSTAIPAQTSGLFHSSVRSGRNCILPLHPMDPHRRCHISDANTSHPTPLPSLLQSANRRLTPRFRRNYPQENLCPSQAIVRLTCAGSVAIVIDCRG